MLPKNLSLTLESLKYYEPNIFNEAFSIVPKYILFIFIHSSDSKN
jgi:hypothetical protein